MVNSPFYNLWEFISFIFFSYLQDWMGFYLKASCNNFAMWPRAKRIKNKMKIKWNYDVSMLFT